MTQQQVVQKQRDRIQKLLNLELEYKMKLEKAKRLKQLLNSKYVFEFEKLLSK
jgi:hypothetical protein